MIIWETPEDAQVPFLLKFNINTQLRYLNTLDSDDTYTDHLGLTRDVHKRNDITVNRAMFILGGYVFDPRARYSFTVWTSAGAASIVVASNIGWQFNKALTVTAGYTGVPGSRSLVNTFPFFTATDRSMLPTLAAAAGEPNVVEKLKKGYKSGNKTFKVHIDGYNLLPFLKGEVKENPRKGFLYWSDDGDLMALRIGNWKCEFMQQRGHGLDVWKEPLVSSRAPNIYNLRSDPFERATEDATMFYGKWMADRAFLLVPAQQIVGEFLQTFKEFPPRQRPASFSIDQALEKARQNQTTMATSGGAGVK